MGFLKIYSHPLLRHLVSRLRDQRLNSLAFRQTVGDIARYMVYEALQNSDLIQITVPALEDDLQVDVLDEKNMVIIPILRAALPMVEAILPLFPDATGGFLAMKRDEETFESKLYYDRLPNLSGKKVILCDPMFATGGSLSDAIDAIKDKGATDISFLNIIASVKGIEFIQKRHPDVKLFIAQVDEKVVNGFLVPGIGDAGDRAYNTL